MKLAVTLLILTLLTNNMVLAGELWADLCRDEAGISHLIGENDHYTGAEPNSDDHDGHSSHCCHLQNHFQSITQKSESLSPVFSSLWTLMTVEQPHSRIFSPPFRPPIV